MPPESLASPALIGRTRPLRVAVLIGLERTPSSGGHIKTWERLAEAIVRRATPVTLDVHVLGRRAAVQALSPEVRFVVHRPVFSTRHLPFLRAMPDHADLASRHRTVEAALRDADVIHTTDAHFAFARSAVRVAAATGAALVTSLHTQTVGYTRVFSEQLIAGLAGRGVAGRFLLDTLRLPHRLERRMAHKFAIHLAACNRIMASVNDDLPALEALAATGRCRAPQPRVSILRRGIDTTRFNPARRDRPRLLQRIAQPEGTTVILFVGRIDRSKNVATLGEAARLLLDRGSPLHVVWAGDGSQRASMAALLGPNATFLGNVPQAELGWLYASSDLFVFPSRLDVAPNVVVEAKASGLPVVVAPYGGDRYVAHSGADGVIVIDPAPAAWADAIAALIADPARRAAIGTAGHRDALSRFPSWDTVLEQDVLPVWQAASQRT